MYECEEVRKYYKMNVGKIFKKKIKFIEIDLKVYVVWIFYWVLGFLSWEWDNMNFLLCYKSENKIIILLI